MTWHINITQLRIIATLTPERGDCRNTFANVLRSDYDRILAPKGNYRVTSTSGSLLIPPVHGKGVKPIMALGKTLIICDYIYTWSYENRVSKHFVIFLNFPGLIACLLLPSRLRHVVWRGSVGVKSSGSELTIRVRGYFSSEFFSGCVVMMSCRVNFHVVRSALA